MTGKPTTRSQPSPIITGSNMASNAERINKLEAQLSKHIENTNKKFCEMNQRISELENQIKHKDTIIEEFRTQIANLNNESTNNSIKSVEQSILSLRCEMIDTKKAEDRKGNLIISGNSLPTVQPWEDPIKIATDLVSNELGNEFNGTIKKAIRIGRKPTTGTEDKRSILIELRNPETKYELFKRCKMKKPNFFLNEQLTPTRSSIYYVLRKARQKHPNKISHIRSYDGEVSAYIKNADGTATRRATVNTKKDLDDLLQELFDTTSAEFLDNWPTQV